jgi:hypothetical protein
MPYRINSEVMLSNTNQKHLTGGWADTVENAVSKYIDSYLSYRKKYMLVFLPVVWFTVDQGDNTEKGYTTLVPYTGVSLEKTKLQKSMEDQGVKFYNKPGESQIDKSEEQRKKTTSISLRILASMIEDK